MAMISQSSEANHLSVHDNEPGIDVRYYLAVLKSRILYFLAPLALIATVGTTVVMKLPPIYLAEGRILVESQQIPTELVRSTVTASAKERIQVIEQRVLTRDNLMLIIEKYGLFADKRHKLSTTELLDLMRTRTRFHPYELDATRRRSDLTIALQIAFEHEQPRAAMQVANELMTLILAEDARNRSSRAQETTGFLIRELKRLEAELGAVEAQIADYRQRNTADPLTEKMSQQYATLKAEYQEKAALYSERHPEITRLKRQLAAIEEVVKRSGRTENGLDILQNNRANIQKNIELTTQKVGAARLGESLESGQFAERLQVLENAILPQRPIKPNRGKLIGAVIMAGLLAGAAVVVLIELLSATIRAPRDLWRVVDPHLIVSIPRIVTAAEERRRKTKLVLATSGSAVSGIVGLAGLHLVWKPLDEIWYAIIERFLG
jgi:uncharacterized protein involved in exopolysaccharide biosynthesis